MKDFFFFFLLGWGFGGRGHKPFPPIGQSRGKIPGTYFFYPIHITERQTYKKNCPKGSGGSAERGYPIFIGGPGTGYILS